MPDAAHRGPFTAPRLSLDYSLHFKDEKTRQQLIVKHTISELVSGRNTDQFVKELFVSKIGPDLSATFTPKVYVGTGIPIQTRPGLTQMFAYRLKPVGVSPDAHAALAFGTAGRSMLHPSGV